MQFLITQEMIVFILMNMEHLKISEHGRVRTLRIMISTVEFVFKEGMTLHIGGE